MGSDCDGDAYESLATLLAVANAALAKQENHYYCSYSSRARTAAVYDMSLLMHDIDGSAREDNRLRVKRARRVSLAPPTKRHLGVR